MKNVEIKDIELDYIHSSNVLFSFMKEAKHLKQALASKCVFPRYCEEDIKYLDLESEGKQIETISVLQKCFCDIPLHRITKQFPIMEEAEKKNIDEESFHKNRKGSTHTDFYGAYGIAFSKNWALSKNFQPVQYVNPDAAYAKQFKSTFEFVLNQNDIDDSIVADIITRLAYFKPLHGEMTRIKDGKRVSVSKNFYDECEWRFVPRDVDLEKYKIASVIFDDETKRLSTQISERITNNKYKDLRLDFEFQDIRYLIVPNMAARIDLIDFIMSLKLESNDETQEKYLLISKILVLDDIEKDF